MIFYFERTVVDADMSKADKINCEFPLILQKISRAYAEYGARYGTKNLWSDRVLPAYFWEQRRSMAASLSSIEAFLAHGDVVYGSDLFMPLEEFKLALKSFEQVSSYKHAKLTPDTLRGPLQAAGCRIVRETRAWKHHGPKLRDYVIGCDLNLGGGGMGGSGSGGMAGPPML